MCTHIQGRTYTKTIKKKWDFTPKITLFYFHSFMVCVYCIYECLPKLLSYEICVHQKFTALNSFCCITDTYTVSLFGSSVYIRCIGYYRNDLKKNFFLFDSNLSNLVRIIQRRKQKETKSSSLRMMPRLFLMMIWNLVINYFDRKEISEVFLLFAFFCVCIYVCMFIPFCGCDLKTWDCFKRDCDISSLGWSLCWMSKVQESRKVQRALKT